MNTNSNTYHHPMGWRVDLFAGLHSLLVASTGSIVEYSLGTNPMLHKLATEDFSVTNGYVNVPERPGLGATVDERFVNKFTLKK